MNSLYLYMVKTGVPDSILLPQRPYYLILLKLYTKDCAVALWFVRVFLNRQPKMAVF